MFEDLQLDLHDGARSVFGAEVTLNNVTFAFTFLVFFILSLVKTVLL